MTLVAIKTERTEIAKTGQLHSLQSLMSSLVGMAECRQASVSQETLRIVTKKLAEFPPECVKAAISKLAETPRAEGETAFPDLGKIKAAVMEEVRAQNARERMRKMHAQQEKDFWDWVDFRVEVTGKAEQEILDAVRVPGYTGRKARQ